MRIALAILASPWATAPLRAAVAVAHALRRRAPPAEVAAAHAALRCAPRAASFVALGPAARDALFVAMAASALAPARQLFHALKRLGGAVVLTHLPAGVPPPAGAPAAAAAARATRTGTASGTSGRPPSTRTRRPRTSTLARTSSRRAPTARRSSSSAASSSSGSGCGGGVVARALARAGIRRGRAREGAPARRGRVPRLRGRGLRAHVRARGARRVGDEAEALSPLKVRAASPRRRVSSRARPSAAARRSTGRAACARRGASRTSGRGSTGSACARPGAAAAAAARAPSSTTRSTRSSRRWACTAARRAAPRCRTTGPTPSCCRGLRRARARVRGGAAEPQDRHGVGARDFIAFGDRFGDKQGGVVTWLAQAAATGRCRFVARCRADAVRRDAATGRAVGVTGSVAGDDGAEARVAVRARRAVVASAGRCTRPRCCCGAACRTARSGAGCGCTPSRACSAGSTARRPPTPTAARPCSRARR